MLRGSILVLASLAITPAQARELEYLKGITSVSYMGIVELKTKHCDIDMKAWNISIDFIANQSTKLKFLREADFTAQVRARSDKLKPSDQSNAPAIEALRKFASMPALWFDIATQDMDGECAGNIVAEVKANLNPSEVISTGALITQPDFILWSDKHLLSASFQEFSSFAIRSSEQSMKKFVNDWTAAQKLP